MIKLGFKTKILNQTLSLFLQINKTRKPKSFTVFNYHQVGKKFIKGRFASGTFTKLSFLEKQLKLIKKNYKVIPLAEAIEMANTDSLDDNYACITFDDGDKSIAESMQLLEKYKLPATFFINSGYLDNQKAYWFNIYNFIRNSRKHRHLLTDEIKTNFKQLRKTLDPSFYNQATQQIENLFPHVQQDFDQYVDIKFLENINTELFDIGLHGSEHQRFGLMDPAWQKQKILEDIKVLSKLKSYKPIFAIPFGRPHDWSFETIDILRELNLDFVYADGGVNTGKSVGYKRIPADSVKLKKAV